MTKPTQEHIEAAKTICPYHGKSSVVGICFCDRIVAFLATRDAERDAEWKALENDCRAMMDKLVAIGLITDRQWFSTWFPRIAALANLGAEEKPKCGECGGSGLVSRAGHTPGCAGNCKPNCPFEEQHPCPSCSAGEKGR